MNIKQYWIPSPSELQGWPLSEPYGVYSCGTSLTLISGFDPKLLETADGRDRVVRALKTGQKIWRERIGEAIKRGAI